MSRESRIRLHRTWEEVYRRHRRVKFIWTMIGVAVWVGIIVGVVWGIVGGGL